MNREKLIEYIKSNDLKNKYHGVSFQHFTDEELLFLKEGIDEGKGKETEKQIIKNKMLTLADLDSLYKTTISQLSAESRLSYCIKHLDKIQSVLTKNAGALDKQQKGKLREIIQATQNEISKLGIK